MRTFKKILLFLVALALIGGFLAVYVFHNIVYITTDDAYIDGRIYTLAPKIPGTVKSVLVDDNQLVKKSELLVEIDPLDYERHFD